MTMSNTNTQLLDKRKHLQEQLNFLINRSKQKYYPRMKKNILMSAKAVRLIGSY